VFIRALEREKQWGERYARLEALQKISTQSFHVSRCSRIQREKNPAEQAVPRKIVDHFGQHPYVSKNVFFCTHFIAIKKTALLIDAQLAV
jgi:hypothetical protein